MAAPTRPLALAAALLVSTTGCPVYNQECSPLVSNPDDISGWLGGDVKTTKPEVRTKDNAIGQMVAEAYFHAFDLSPERLRPDFGLENAGSIRSEGVCVSRETVKKGPVRRKVLREVLPFNDQVVVVPVTHKQLKNIFEHAVSGLSPAGTTSPPGAFLQLYGGTVAADCKQPAETLNADGTRGREGSRITAISLQKRDGTTFDVPLNPPSETETVRIALNSFMLQGGDNYIDLKGMDPNGKDALSAGGFNYEIIAAYFKATYTEASPLPAAPAARWIMTDCK